MALQRHLVIAASVLLLSGCTVGIGPAGGGPPPGHPVPPPAQPHLLTQAEAEHIALKMAAERGYTQPRFHHVQWKDEQLQWKIDLRGGVDGREAKLQMCLDARDGRVVELKDKRQGKPDKDDDDEDDKDEKHGKKQGKGHDKKDGGGDEDDGDDD